MSSHSCHLLSSYSQHGPHYNYDFVRFVYTRLHLEHYISLQTSVLTSAGLLLEKMTSFPRRVNIGDLFDSIYGFFNCDFVWLWRIPNGRPSTVWGLREEFFLYMVHRHHIEVVFFVSIVYIHSLSHLKNKKVALCYYNR